MKSGRFRRVTHFSLRAVMDVIRFPNSSQEMWSAKRYFYEDPPRMYLAFTVEQNIKENLAIMQSVC